MCIVLKLMSSKTSQIWLGDVFPNFKARTTIGVIDFHEYIDRSWCIFFSHPQDFTPICTTELTQAAMLAPEFEKRNVKMVALSCNDVSTHLHWIDDIKTLYPANDEFPYPFIEDCDREIAKRLGILDAESKDANGDPITCRACFIIGPDKRLKSSLFYPISTGRNFAEILRVTDSLQLCHEHHDIIGTPVDWKQGDECIIQKNVSTVDALKLFPLHRCVSIPSREGYMRFVSIKPKFKRSISDTQLNVKRNTWSFEVE